MNKFIIAGAILMALTATSLATDVDPKVDGCITKEQVAARILNAVPDATGLVTGDVVTFTAPSYPETNLVLTFKDSCLIKVEEVQKNAS